MIVYNFCWSAQCNLPNTRQLQVASKVRSNVRQELSGQIRDAFEGILKNYTGKNKKPIAVDESGQKNLDGMKRLLKGRQTIYGMLNQSIDYRLSLCPTDCKGNESDPWMLYRATERDIYGRPCWRRFLASLSQIALNGVKPGDFPNVNFDDKDVIRSIPPTYMAFIELVVRLIFMTSSEYIVLNAE